MSTPKGSTWAVLGAVPGRDSVSAESSCRENQEITHSRFEVKQLTKPSGDLIVLQVSLNYKYKWGILDLFQYMRYLQVLLFDIKFGIIFLQLVFLLIREI